MPANHNTSLPRFATGSQSRPVARPGGPEIGLEPVGSAGRTRLEACIAETFARTYDARIEHFLPFLLSLKHSSGLGAVAGLNLAGQSPLFLEQYLDRPVEQAVAGIFRTPVDRAQIVEIGNLASAAQGSAALLFGLLPVLLHEAGIRWVVCTATPQIRSMLDRMDFQTHTICTANADVLGDRKDDWGSYYDCQPDVVAGDVERAVGRALTNKYVGRLALALAEPISDIAASLQIGD